MSDFSSPAVVRGLVTLAAVFLIVGALDTLRALLAPVVAAFVTGVVSGPFIDWFEGRGIPGAVAACIALILLAIFCAGLLMMLEATISHAIANWPQIWFELRGVIDFVRGAVSGVQELQVQVTEAVASDDTAEAASAEADPVPVPSLMNALTYGPSLLAGVLVFLGTLYFFLATRMSTYRGIARLFPGASPELFLAAERRVSRYFLSITMVNSGFGVLTFLLMSALGMPQPVMGGLAVFLANFILYLAPALVPVARLVVGIMTFDGAMSFVPMLAFIGMNILVSQFVTPTFVGRQMCLNPLLVFLSLAVWLWFWGPLGGLIAIPALVWLLLVLDHRAAAVALEYRDQPA